MDDIKQIKIEDKEYPELLKRISNPPKVIYYRGTLPKDPCFAIVGARKCSETGKQAAQEISKNLSAAGLIIISGLASGIDTVAHKACVDNRRRTIAVLGTGLDERVIYPKENIQLSRDILKNGGCLISELPPNNRGSKFSFPNRNRIISALSSGVLAIEAKEKSGSMITVNYATIQNKKLFLFPDQKYTAEDILKKIEITPKT